MYLTDVRGDLISVGKLVTILHLVSSHMRLCKSPFWCQSDSSENANDSYCCKNVSCCLSVSYIALVDVVGGRIRYPVSDGDLHRYGDLLDALLG